MIAQAPHLRVISRIGVGYDSVDVAAATARNIVVCTTVGSNNHAVAEMALGLMLGLALYIYITDRAIRAGEWPATTGPEMWGKTLGTNGAGQIIDAKASIGDGFNSTPASSASQFAFGLGVLHRF